MNDFQVQIWKNNYKAPQDKTIQDTFLRVAAAVAKAEPDKETRELLATQFYKIMSQWKFIPGGRIIANAGSGNKKATLYNCYVYHPYDFGIRDIDSMQGIFQTLKKSAKILASQGGLGVNLSFIRPNGSYIVGTGARTPGVVKFMELWDKASDVITMGSSKVINDKFTSKAKKKIRKGAMLAAMDISHPEIKDFIIAKQTSNRLTKFNLSVLVPDRFMKALDANQMWKLCFPDIEYANYKEQWDGDLQRWISQGKPIVVYEQIPARELWDLIMLSTYNRNQPGILFYDTINDYNPVSYCQRILTTNPCGQIGMPSNVCNLGSLNLPKFYEQGNFNWEEFQRVIKLGVCFLDDVADISFVPLSEYEQKIKQKRRIGLGVMGLGSLLMMMKLKFGSHEAIEFVDELFKFKAEVQLMTSAFLGKSKGSFTAFDREQYFTSRWWYELPISYKIKREIENIGQMRNSVHSTVPPTGNSSVFTGQVSNGIQPVFMKEYTRWVTMTDQQVEQLQHRHENYQMNKFTSGYQLQNHIYQKIPNPKLGQWYQTAIFKFADRGNEQILRGQIDGTTYQIDKNRGLIKPMQVIDYGWKYVKQNIQSSHYDWCVTTNELTVEDHINMLATSAKYINQNQSKTINIVEDYSYQQFKNVYISAWRKKIKGVTSYRAGTMTVVLEQKKKLQEQQTQLEKLFKGNNGDIIFQDVKLPEKSYALQYKVKDKYKKKWYFTISFADKELTKPFAFFIRTNNRESNEVADLVIQSMQELLISLGIREELIADQRQKYKDQTNVDKIGRAIGMALRHNIPIVKIVETLNTYNDGLSTLMFHVKKILSGFIKDGTKVAGGNCEICGSTELVYQSGCSTCNNCGSSKCQ